MDRVERKASMHAEPGYCPWCHYPEGACICAPTYRTGPSPQFPSFNVIPKKATTMHLYDKLRLAREGAAVERCHTAPHLLRYSVGHHSLDLVNLITLAWMEDHEDNWPRAQLLIAAAWHDIPERIIGDVPQPVKMLLDGKLDAVEEMVFKSVGVDVNLSSEESRYLHEGDRVELWLWCHEEMSRGNENFLGWITGYDEHFEKSPPVPAYQRIMEEVRIRGLPRLEFELLKEVAGL